jgi:hypothetical protein
VGWYRDQIVSRSHGADAGRQLCHALRQASPLRWRQGWRYRARDRRGRPCHLDPCRATLFQTISISSPVSESYEGGASIGRANGRKPLPDRLLSPGELVHLELILHRNQRHGGDRYDWTTHGTDEPSASPRHDRHRRRKLGDVSGDDHHGARSRVDLQRADPARRRPEGRVGSDPWGGGCRPRRGVRVAPDRLQGADARIQRPRGRPLLVFARLAIGLPSSAAFSRSVVSPKTSTSIPDPGGFPITTAASSTIASAWASALNRSFRSTTTPIYTRRMPLAASRSACATYCQISRAA